MIASKSEQRRVVPEAQKTVVLDDGINVLL